MPRLPYEKWKPRGDAQLMVARANSVAADYQQQGYDLTLRQLYYQFVSRGWIPNKQTAYKQLGEVVNRGRMAGLIDWNYITDRTRNLAGIQHMEDPAASVERAANRHWLDHWSDQPARVEVWVEKEALAGVVSRAAVRRHVDYFSCRGYVSQSEMWSAAQRHLRYINNGQRVVIIHLGDHDPSGIDMTRDITDRLTTFINYDFYRAHQAEIAGTTFSQIESVMIDHIDGMAVHPRASEGPPFEVRRIALNMDQVEEYDPPPNPAKLTDSRSAEYCERFGDESWELDALDPATLDGLITAEIEGIVDEDRYDAVEATQNQERELLTELSARWYDVADSLRELMNPSDG